MPLVRKPYKRLAPEADAHAVAFAMRQGKFPIAYARERGWTADRLESALNALSKYVSQRYGLIPTEDVFNQFVIQIQKQLEDLEKVKALFSNGPEHAVTQTISTVEKGPNGKPVKSTVTHTTPARHGVSAGDVIRVCDLMISAARQVVDTGIALGVTGAPKAEEGPKVVNNIQNILIQAVQSGDWDTVRAIKDGRAVQAALPPGADPDERVITVDLNKARQHPLPARLRRRRPPGLSKAGKFRDYYA